MYERNFFRKGFLCLFCSIAIFIVQSFAQFPPECATETNLLVEKRCCPVNVYTGLECGGPGRGGCQYIDNQTIEARCINCSQYFYRYEDERTYWPYKFFHEWCVCEWPFQGSSCNECVWGYYGEECDVKRVLVRKNIMKKENREIMENTVKYMDWLKHNTSNDFVFATCTLDVMEASNAVCYTNTSYYNAIVWTHWYSSSYYTSQITSTSSAIQDFIHPSSAFPIWHRLLILIWERAVQKISGDDQFAMPYYKWIGDVNCSICTEDKFGLSTGEFGYLTENSPFKSWMTICLIDNIASEGKLCDPNFEYTKLFRFPGQGVVDNFPGVGQLEATLRWPVYDTPPYFFTSTNSFRNVLYGRVLPTDGYSMGQWNMHNGMHAMFNGSATPRTHSPNDPVFAIFHTYVDMILEMWVQRWGGEEAYDAYPIKDATQQNNRYDYLVTVFPPVVVDSLLVDNSSEIGYVYEDLYENA